MADYAVKYRITFKNEQEDDYRIDILEKDYTGNITTLIGAGNAFIQKYGNDERPYIPINASDTEINFWATDTVTLESFYSEDDEQFRIDYYCDTSQEILLNKLLWRGFIVQDDCTEDFQDAPFVITLAATDNIGLLKETAYNVAQSTVIIKNIYESGTSDVVITGGDTIEITLPIIVVLQTIYAGDILTYDGVDYTIKSYTFVAPTLTIVIEETFPADGSFTDKAYEIYHTVKLIEKTLLFDYIRIALTTTGISLPLRIYSNIYENTQDDRGDTDTAEFFSQTRLYSGMFLSEDGGWANLYDILVAILTPLNATLLQADGYWNIIRFGEAYLFSNEIPGTEYDENFENPVAITLDPNFLIELGTPGIPVDNEFINADAIRRIVRPFKFINETFNYQQPSQLILGSDLQRLGAFIGTSTVGSLRYDDYEIPDVWRHDNSDPVSLTYDASFIRIVTDTITNTEVERFVYDPTLASSWQWLIFNPIEVSAGDKFDFSLQFKTDTDSTDYYYFEIRFQIITPAGDLYNLLVLDNYLQWDGIYSAANYKVARGQFKRIQKSTQYETWTLSEFTTDTDRPLTPKIKEDGILLISIAGANVNSPGQPSFVQFKDISITFTNTINDSTDIIGQTHTTSQDNNIKNVYDEEIKIDDSPRNTIAGTLFTNDITTFEAGIGDIYFTKTSLWHRIQNSEALRLGEITTFERKFLSFVARTIIEGTFTRVRYEKDDTIRFISPLNIVQIASLPGLNFIMGVSEINYAESLCNTTLWELYKDSEGGGSDEPLDFTYLFKYLYKTS